MGFLISLGLAVIGMYALFVGFAVVTSVTVHVASWLFSLRSVRFVFKSLWVGVKAAFLLCFAFTPIGLLVIWVNSRDKGLENFLRGVFPEFPKAQVEQPKPGLEHLPLLDDIFLRPEKYLPEGCPPTSENLHNMMVAAATEINRLVPVSA